MKVMYWFFAGFLFLFQFYKVNSEVIYTDPVINAQYVKTGNNIIIGFDKTVSKSITNDPLAVTVTGNLGGNYSGTITLLERGKKIIFTADTPFKYGETVTVRFNSGKYTPGSKHSGTFEYTFTTENYRTITDALNKQPDFYSYDLFKNTYKNSNYSNEIPQLTVTVNISPEEGKLFISNFPFTNVPSIPHLIISNNDGSIYAGIKLAANSLDFKKQPNGNLTYFDNGKFKYYELSEGYTKIDSFYCGNGYLTDGHELRLYKDSHAFLMSYDTQTVDMSAIINGGNPNAVVIGLVIQEIDEFKNVVFQWRSWDHIPITDALHQDLTTASVDYIHGNAIEVDNDGNIMISSRHLDEITKIDRHNGDIIWRLGGGHNEFTFINDPDGFNYQHGIRRLPNGNIILFDNGNFHTPPHSRAVEYTLDEVNKTATLVWQYRNSPDNFGFAMGFAQRLDGGNTLISWGATSPALTEVTPAGDIALEVSLPPGEFSYRTFKYSWSGVPIYIDQTAAPIPTAFKLSQNYPNPFNPLTKIDFDLPENSFVNLSVFDILGRLVKTIINQDMRASFYSFDFNSGEVPSGVYFYRLRAGDFSETKKMIIVK